MTGLGDRNRKYQMPARYGITVEEYAEMLSWQNGRCAICGAGKGCEGQENLSVDHDHRTGRVRGLLCSNCNNGLGRFQDNPELLLAAAAYLLDPAFHRP